MLLTLRTVTALVLLSSFSSCQAFQSDKSPSDSDEIEHVIFLVRHGEKCTDQGDDPALTVSGTQRSSDLARTLKDVPLEAIYSTPFRRTIATAQPTATLHGLDIIETPTESGFLEKLATRLMAGSEKYVLVSGHSNTTPKLVNLLAGTALDDLHDDVYDRLYIVETRSGGRVDVLTMGYGAESAALTACGS